MGRTGVVLHHKADVWDVQEWCYTTRQMYGMYRSGVTPQGRCMGRTLNPHDTCHRIQGSFVGVDPATWRYNQVATAQESGETSQSNKYKTEM